MRRLLSKEAVIPLGFFLLSAVTLFAWRQLSQAADVAIAGGSVAGLIVLLLLTMVPPALVMWMLPRLGGGGLSLLVILVVGVAIRVPFLDRDPLLSDDLHRYLWDGQLQVEGINPYRYAPIDVDIEGLPESLATALERLNHPEVVTVYPPLLEECFSLAALASFGAKEWRIFILAVEALLVLMLIRLLEKRDLDPRRIVLYLWHPLAVVENAWSGHAEGIAVLLFLWALTLFDEERPVSAAFAVGAAIAAKLLPLGLLPLLWRRGKLACLLLTAAVVLWCFFPYRHVDIGEATAGLGEYAGSWYFNDLLYRPLGTLFGIDAENRHDSGALLLRGALLLAWVVVCIATMKKEPLVAGLAITTAFVLLTPTLHPWYLLWVLPLTVVVRAPALWLLSGTVLISYEVIDRWRGVGEWVEHPLTRALVFTAPLLWLAAAALQSLRDRRQKDGTPSR